MCATHYLLNPNFVESENLTYKYLNGVYYFGLGLYNCFESVLVWAWLFDLGLGLSFSLFEIG